MRSQILSKTTRLIFTSKTLLMIFCFVLVLNDKLNAQSEPEQDTISNFCYALGVSSDGSTGQLGEGGVNLDYTYSGADCDPNANVYLYSGGPLLIKVKGTDTLVLSSFNRVEFDPTWGFQSQGHYCFNENDDQVMYISDQFIDTAYSISIRRRFIIPKNPTVCGYVIQLLQVSTNNNFDNGELLIGEIVDWNIPSDSGNVNTSGIDLSEHLIYQQGVEIAEDCDNNPSTPDEFCSNCLTGTTLNNQRYGGISFMESYPSSAEPKDPYSAFTIEKASILESNGQLKPGVLWQLGDNPAFSATDSIGDQVTVMIYEKKSNTRYSDYNEYMTIMATVREGDEHDLKQIMTTAKADVIAGKFDFRIPCPYETCCLGIRGNVNNDSHIDDRIDISDLLYLVDYFFLPGSCAPICLLEEDVNGSGYLDIEDMLCLVDYLFEPNPSCEPAPCPGW